VKSRIVTCGSLSVSPRFLGQEARHARFIDNSREQGTIVRNWQAEDSKKVRKLPLRTKIPSMKLMNALILRSTS